jgi:sugar/nucleoside kinase (ribokinase family)
VVGELNVDVVVACAGPPAFGQQETLVDDARLTLGSSGAITAVAAARLGLTVAYLGVVGDDLLGRHVVERLESEGVATDLVIRRPELPTGMTVVLAVPGGDRAMLTHLGSIGQLRRADVPDEALSRARHVHASSFYLQGGFRAELADVFDRARAGGATCSVDPNWDPSGQWARDLVDLLDHADYLLLNDAEAGRLTGLRDPAAAARELASDGCAVAVKCGAAGSVLAEGPALTRMPAVDVDVVDTTGAGDNFNAGFLAARLRGEGFPAALAWGNALGALSTRAAGGTTADPAGVGQLAADLLAGRHAAVAGPAS